MLGWDRHASDLFYKNPSYFYSAQGNRSNQNPCGALKSSYAFAEAEKAQQTLRNLRERQKHGRALKKAIATLSKEWTVNLQERR